MTVQIMIGDCRDILDTLSDASVQCVVTSPPYYGLRDYGEDDQIGLEETPEQYIAEMVDVFREVRRVLRDDGTVWLNLGDSYAGAYSGNNGYNDGRTNRDKRRGPGIPVTCKPKDLIGIPWRVAFALQADGWWLRSDIIWHKPNPMPESVTDRPTKAHEYVFLLTKSARYYYDADAVREGQADSTITDKRVGRNRWQNGGGSDESMRGNNRQKFGTMNHPTDGRRNRRTVWSIATKPYSGAHFAVMPPDLVEPCIKAGTSERGACPECGAPWERVVERSPMEVRPGPSRDMRSQNGHLRTQVNGTMTKPPTSTTVGWQPTCDCGHTDTVPCVVLDPFAGAGTVGLVGDRLGQDAILIELNPTYARMAQRRIVNDAPMFARVEVIE